MRKRMRNKAGRLLLLTLALTLLISLLLSCGEVRIVAEEEEILTAARDLIEKSILWNTLFYIEGIPTLASGRTSGIYKEADPAFLEALGFENISDIKAYAAEIYSEDMMKTIEETLFSSIRDGNGSVFSGAACMDYKEKNEDGDMVFVCVMVNPGSCPFIQTDALEYLYDSMQVTYNLNYRATVSITVKGIGEMEDAETVIRVNLIMENDRWYLDNNTFASLPRKS